MPTGEAILQLHKPKSARVKSPPGKVVSRRTDQRVWVFKGSRVPLRALFEAMADGESVGESVKRFPIYRRRKSKMCFAVWVFWLITSYTNTR
jgi:hypothetical protein